MQNRFLVFVAAAAALALSACGGGSASKCAAVTCGTGQLCDTATGKCVSNGTGGGSSGTGGGSSGTGGGSSGTGGGSSGTGGGSSGTGGGSSGTGGGSSGTGGGTSGTGGGTSGTGGGIAFDGGVLGETCAMPTSITSGQSFVINLTAQRNDYRLDAVVGACRAAGIDGAGDAVFQFSVTAGNRGTLTAVGDSDTDVFVNLVAAPASRCGAVQPDGGFGGITCVDGSDVGGLNEADEVSTAIPGTYYAIVDGLTDADVGNVAVSFATTTVPATGDTCAAPTVVASSGMLTAQSGAGYGNDYDVDPDGTDCTTYSSNGIDRVYQVSIPAGMTLTATVTPSGAGANDDVSIYVLEGVAASCTPWITSCLAGADVGADGEADEVTYMNAGAAAKTVFVVVDSYFLRQPSAFDLNIQVQ
ncbi:MAG: hypothetical protein IPJ65_16765 [Archangiaceae bacterium]|nr:hypothetical protein [Archangiaceae bacterium]